jgi:L-serine deaminase
MTSAERLIVKQTRRAVERLETILKGPSAKLGQTPAGQEIRATARQLRQALHKAEALERREDPRLLVYREFAEGSQGKP